jgi:uncharacterized protein YkwD
MYRLATWVALSAALLLGPPGAPLLAGAGALGAPVHYSIGEPTDDEQHMLELINRARYNAIEEALRFMTTTDPDVLAAYVAYHVDLNVMTNQFSWLGSSVPPLAMNAKLIASARLHSQDMLLNRFQGHNSSTNPPPPDQPGDSPLDRVLRQSYPATYWGENAYAYGQSIFHAHAAFAVDWGSGSNTVGGMQSPPGHRNTIYRYGFYGYSEIGVGIVTGSVSNFGPYFVTEDFGSVSNPSAFITGVAHYDLNGNAFYDPGEGLGGLTVAVLGLPTAGVTAVSGGYAVPVPSNGAYTVTVSGPGMAAVTNTVTVSAGRNQRFDFRPAYVAPAIVGPPAAFPNATNSYAVTPLAGATNHDARALLLLTNAWSEGAETGTNTVILNTDQSYSPFATSAKVSGAYSFHLAHTARTDQIVTLARLIYVQTTNASLLFWSRLGAATTNQIAKVQISPDDGVNWTAAYTQCGAGGGVWGETNFFLRTLPLSAFANRMIRIRFVYEIRPGSYYSSASHGYGWYIDDISAPGTREANVVACTSLGSATGFDWVPPVKGDYVLQVRGTYDRRIFAFSPPLFVPVTDLRLAINGFDQLAGDQRLLRVRATSGTPATLGLESAASLAEGFSPVSASSSGPTNGEYWLLYTAPTNTAARFYRVWGR